MCEFYVFKIHNCLEDFDVLESIAHLTRFFFFGDTIFSMLTTGASNAIDTKNEKRYDATTCPKNVIIWNKMRSIRLQNSLFLFCRIYEINEIYHGVFS